jgi:hypothetical protein
MQRQVLGGDVGSSYFGPAKSGGRLRAGVLPDLDESRKRDAEDAELAVEDLRRLGSGAEPPALDSSASDLLAALNEVDFPAQIELPASTLSGSGAWLGADVPGVVSGANTSWLTRMLQGFNGSVDAGGANGRGNAKRRLSKSGAGLSATNAVQPTFGTSPEEQLLSQMEAKTTLDVKLKDEQLQVSLHCPAD